jgi:hypothetical protein
MEIVTTHMTYMVPVWSLVTWVMLLILAWCIVGMKKKIDKLTDKICELDGKTDAYFGLPRLDGEAVKIRDMEVRRIREEISHQPVPSDDKDDICNDSDSGCPR